MDIFKESEVTNIEVCLVDNTGYHVYTLIKLYSIDIFKESEVTNIEVCLVDNTGYHVYSNQTI